ncbi:VOC family protein [Kitasatospora sp. NBC_01560]|uniref:VOC family protein n=1 Tax=Kitasatospora sp. NBC_01560 TaxID=2975965 RepID=UPI00386853AA
MLTTAFTPGSPNWLDLTSPDTDASVAFYATVFGWTFAPTELPGPDPDASDSRGGSSSDGSGLFRHDGRTVAALTPLTGSGSGSGSGSGWTIHFCTPDAGRTARLVEAAGGTVRPAPPGARATGFTDPTGAGFAVREPFAVPGLEAVDGEGALCWAECHSIDAEAAKVFYRAVLSWQEQDVPLGEAMYTVLTPAGGGTDDALGGITQLGPEQTAAGTASHWLPYIEVPDVDAAVALAGQLGATVRVPATDVHGVGRLAQLIDPHGAAFAVITSTPRDG